MSIALDLGTHACRSLRCRPADLAARRFRSVVAMFPDGQLLRTWLKGVPVPYVPCDDHLAVSDQHAEQMAELFSVCCHDLLIDGIVPFADPVIRQLLALVVEGLLPPAEGEDSICCFTHPGYRRTRGPTDRDLDRRLEFVSRLIRLRGYVPEPINPAVALGLAEMEPERFTGIALCLGASSCDAALLHRGNPAAVMHLPRGGRSIDEALARRLGLTCQDLFGQKVLDVEQARRRKETFTLEDLSDDDRRFVAAQYRQLLAELARGLEKLVAANPLLTRFAQPLTIVLGGGAVRIAGFETLLQEEMSPHPSLAAVRTIRLAQPGDFTIARGCLIHATLGMRSRLEPQRKSA